MADRGGARGGGFASRGDRGGDRGRGRGRGRGRRGGAKDSEKEWQPVTKLGRLVKAGKIKSMEEIYLHSLPIKEYQIVDFFLPKLKDEVMKIKPVQKQTRAGQRTRFKAIVIIGDSEGHVGLGIKTSKEVATAIRAAIIIAKLSVIPVRRGYWGTNLGLPHSLPVKESGKCGSVTVRLIPAPRGTQIVASPAVKRLLQLAGIEDAYTSSSGSTKTLENTLKATFAAISNTYGFLTPNLWTETQLIRSPLEEYADTLREALRNGSPVWAGFLTSPHPTPVLSRLCPGLPTSLVGDVAGDLNSLVLAVIFNAILPDALPLLNRLAPPSPSSSAIPAHGRPGLTGLTNLLGNVLSAVPPLQTEKIINLVTPQPAATDVASRRAPATLNSIHCLSEGINSAIDGVVLGIAGGAAVSQLPWLCRQGSSRIRPSLRPISRQRLSQEGQGEPNQEQVACNLAKQAVCNLEEGLNQELAGCSQAQEAPCNCNPYYGTPAPALAPYPGPHYTRNDCPGGRFYPSIQAAAQAPATPTPQMPVGTTEPVGGGSAGPRPGQPPTSNSPGAALICTLDSTDPAYHHGYSVSSQSMPTTPIPGVGSSIFPPGPRPGQAPPTCIPGHTDPTCNPGVIGGSLPPFPAQSNTRITSTYTVGARSWLALATRQLVAKAPAPGRTNYPAPAVRVASALRSRLVYHSPTAPARFLRACPVGRPSPSTASARSNPPGATSPSMSLANPTPNPVSGGAVAPEQQPPGAPTPVAPGPGIPTPGAPTPGLVTPEMTPLGAPTPAAPSPGVPTPVGPGGTTPTTAPIGGSAADPRPLGTNTSGYIYPPGVVPYGPPPAPTTLVSVALTWRMADADQASAMLHHMLDGRPQPSDALELVNEEPPTATATTMTTRRS
ncbi:hypothetical protein DL765_000194 [Monosporascus sp. GIB2]|nr:hypothetical protein DL765_000194 [Monosporascus sp. GIB2]